MCSSPHRLLSTGTLVSEAPLQTMCQEGLSETPSHSPEITGVWDTVGQRIAAVKCWGTERTQCGCHTVPGSWKWPLAPPQVAFCSCFSYCCHYSSSSPSTFERADTLTNTAEGDKCCLVTLALPHHPG